MTNKTLIPANANTAPPSPKGRRGNNVFNPGSPLPLGEGLGARVLILFLVFLGLWSASLALDPLQLAGGARSIAMGRTSAAQKADISSIFVNPASASYLKNWGVTSMYSSLLQGEISYTLIGGGKKTDFGSLALGYLGAGTTGLNITTLDANSRVAITGNTFDYTNSVLSLVYSNMINNNLSVGLNLKLFNQAFSNQSNGSANGYDLDLGLIYQPDLNTTLGLIQQNTLPASLGGRLNWGTGQQESLPFKTKVGLNHKIRPDLSLAADLDYKQNSPWLLHGGLEWLTQYDLAFRAGLEQAAISTTNSVINLAAGLGFKANGLIFDYAYYLDNTLTANSTHYFTISYVPPEEKAFAYSQAKQTSRQLFPDVPAGYWAKDAVESLAKAKTITGFPDNTFKPEQPLTRAEFCTLLIKAQNQPVLASSQESFIDVPINHWAAQYIAAAAQENLVSGYPDHTFRPKEFINREEAIKIFVLYSQLKPIGQPTKFPDISPDRWSAGFINQAKAQGWLNYIAEPVFAPKKEFTRAEAAYVLYQAAYRQ